jgi:hypothetical protein
MADTTTAPEARPGTEHRNPPVPPALLESIVAYFQPRRVILLGSVALGEQRLDSDVDLLVVLDDDAPAEKQTLAAGWASRGAYRGPVDIIPCREEIFRRKACIGGTIADAARTEGLVVYERT